MRHRLNSSANHLFEHSHLRLFVGSWRNTTAKQNWVLFPGDPNQAIAEFNEWIIVACAARKGSDEIPPEEVENHMIDRAKKHACVMDVFCCTRWFELAYMIADSEPTSDTDLFSSVVALQV